MHSYLRSIGLSSVDTKEKEDTLIHYVTSYSRKRKQISLSKKGDLQFAEYFCDLGGGFGVGVRGQIDENDKFYFDNYFPYLTSLSFGNSEDITIAKKAESDSFVVLFDDFRFSSSIVFYLQNCADYLMYSEDQLMDFKFPVALTALAQSGTIIMPTSSTKEYCEKLDENLDKEKSLVYAARNGDPIATEQLTLREVEQFTRVRKRIMKEDIFSIVETSFIPYGLESEIYKIFGCITEYSWSVNSYSGEQICILTVLCNGITIRVAVNEKDLIGVPEVGRRFRGVVWLQGEVEFEGII